MYFLFHTALWDHWGALRLISTRSLFRSYSPGKLSSSCKVVPRWAQFCRTAPSICNGQPTGMCDCSRSQSIAILFNDRAKHWDINCDLQANLRSFAAPCIRSKQTSFGEFCQRRKLRLLFQGQCFFFNNQLKAVHRLVLCLSGLGLRLPRGYDILKPGGANRFDPYRVVWVCILNTFPAQTVVHGRNHPWWDKDGDELDVPCYLQILGFKVRCDASDLAVYDSGVWLGSFKRCRNFKAQIQFF